MAMLAPRNAPADTPMMLDSARGFWKKPCMTAPATDSAAPTTKARNTRGSRASHTIRVAVSDDDGLSSACQT